MKYTPFLGPELEFEATDNPDVMVSQISTFVEMFIYHCCLCGQWDERAYSARTGHLLCPRCTEYLASSWENPYGRKRAGAKVRTRLLLSATLRTEVLLRDQYRCRYCGGFESGLVLDHVLPWSRGGADTADNLVTACAACNRKKGDKTPEEAGMVVSQVRT